MFSPLIDELISSLKVLPGVGPKSAQRMALHLLEHERTGAMRLAEALQQSAEKVQQCDNCRTLSECSPCQLCANPRRNAAMVCVVESPADVLAIEQSGTFSGHYFVLHGRLSPIDGIGPADIGLNILVKKMQQAGLDEIIVATNPSMEGEATAHYIADKAKNLNVKVSRIAHGVPIGGELEFIDGGTLAHALSSRREL